MFFDVSTHRLLPSVFAALTVSATAVAQSFVGIEPPPGQATTRVYGLSHDGGTAAGLSASSDSLTLHGFRWTLANGREDYVGSGVPNYTGAIAVSSDALTIVGGMGTSAFQPRRAFRRVGTGPFEDLGVQTGYANSIANAVSSDGSTVVGFSKAAGSGLTREQAFRWTPSTGLEPLGYLDGPTNADGFQSQALGVSADGNTVVGWSSFDSTVEEGFVWRTGIGMQRLTSPGPDLPFAGRGVAVSADGNIVLGEAGNGSQLRPVLYTDLVPQAFTQLFDYRITHPHALSADGSVAVGFASNSPTRPNAPWVWTQGGGMALLSDYLTSHGVSIPSGWQLYDCYAVSGDGRSFGGMVISPDSTSGRGFIATVPTPATIAFLSGTLLYTRRRRR
jgi:uncharacterized membrane protein